MDESIINMSDKTILSKQEFVKGDLLLLDGKYKVICVSQTPMRMFTLVHNEGNELNTWDVMTNRLKKIK